MRLPSVLCLVAMPLGGGLAAWSDGAIVTTVQSAPGTAPTMQELLRMAGEHVVAFGLDLEGIVAREEYVQTVRQWPTSVPTSPGKGRRIEDSARYNLGHIERNINIPTFPMIVLHPKHRARFTFRDHGTLVEDGRPARLLTFHERGRPRLIRDRHGRDMQTQGRVLLDEASGELLRATVEPRADDLYSHLEVTFGVVDGLPRRVPVRMWEWYWLQGVQRDRYVEGFATYHSFRRFTTSVGAPHVIEPPH
jgi:hypothetical protein